MAPTPLLVTPPPEEILERLRALAVSLGADVRVEPFGLRMTGTGGLCRVGGRPVILVDATAGVLDRIGVLASALRALASSDVVPEDLLPYVRSGHAPIGRLLRPRPLARTRRIFG